MQLSGFVFRVDYGLLIEVEHGVVITIVQCKRGGVIMNAQVEDNHDCTSCSLEMEQGICVVFIYKANSENNGVSSIV